MLTALSAVAEVFSVKGSVIDGDGESEIYATVRVYACSDTVRPMVMGVTDMSGGFSLNVAEAGKYHISVASVGKVASERSFSVTVDEPVARLDTIVTEVSENVIGEVVVEAAKPLVAVAVGYRFGSLKATVKKVNKGINNDDVVGEPGN